MTINWSEQVIKIKDLKDYGRNPRRMTKDQFQQLVDSLKEDGYHQRLIVNQDGTIIGGHQRKKALLKSGFKPSDEITVLMPDRLLNEDEFKRLNVRDNLPYGEFDFDILSSDFEIEDLLNWGMPKEWLPDDDKEFSPLDGNDDDRLDQKKMIKCPNCNHEFEN